MFFINLCLISCRDGSVEILFFPLLAQTVTSKLTLSSPQLGVYLYDLILKSIPSGNEKPIQFKVPLGSRQTNSFRFINYCKVKTTYECQVDHPDFFVEKSIGSVVYISYSHMLVANAATVDGSEVSVDVTYEPSKIGDTHANLRIFSEQGGEYITSLFGHCIPPQPQGPIIIRSGTPISIPVFNPFNKTAQFQFHIENQMVFSVKPSEASIPAKKTISVSVLFKGTGPATCKLTATSDEYSSPWIYYLKGTL